MRLKGSPGWPVWLLATVLCLASCWPMAASRAAEADCDALLDQKLFQPQGQNRQAIYQVQRCLVAKGYPPGMIDGYLGPNTWAALEAYWKSLQAPQAAPAPKLADGLGVSYQLTQDDLKALQDYLKALKMGNGVWEQLEQLQGKTYEGSKAFVAAVEESIQAGSDQVAQYLPVVLQHAEETVSYRLSEATLENLKKQDALATVMDKLEDLKGVDFPSKSAAETTIKAGLTCPPPGEPVTAAPPPGEPGTTTPADTPPCQPVPAATLNLILQRLEEVTTYVLSEASLKALAAAPQFIQDPPALIKNIAQLVGIDYPTAGLFRCAILQKAKPLAKDVQDCSLPELEPIVSQARKAHVYDSATRIGWDGNACGCVLDGLSGVTYGFYPYWQAATGQIVNFSVLSRIAYFAVTFDDQGDIAQRFHWQPDKAQFINEARRHGTKVDLVVYRNEWKKWSEDAAAKNYLGIGRLTANIVGILREKLDNSFFNRNKAVLSLGASSTPSIGDGVTLYFEDYPTDDESSLYLSMFIKELRQKLREADKHLYLNVVVPQGALGKGIFSLGYLSQMVPDVDTHEAKYQAQNVVDLFLVLLGEPTTRTKKELTRQVEDLFSGAKLFKGMQRRNMLRKLVPVLTPAPDLTANGNDPRQFRDDVIYFEDNFGGVGLWPLPVTEAKAASAEAKNTNIVAKMVDDSLTADYQADGAEPPSELRKYVCTHKWGFRIAFDVLTALLAAYALLSIFLCQLRRFWARYSWYFLALVALWAGLSLTILFNDPFYTDLAKGNGPLILLVVANLGYLAWMIMSRKQRAQQP